MTIQIHPRFTSERAAYLASSDALSAVYDGPSSRTYREAVQRETAINVARLAHHRSAREYFCEIEVEECDSPELAPRGDGVEGLTTRIERAISSWRAAHREP